jgi:hypothetical protein
LILFILFVPFFILFSIQSNHSNQFILFHFNHFKQQNIFIAINSNQHYFNYSTNAKVHFLNNITNIIQLDHLLWSKNLTPHLLLQKIYLFKYREHEIHRLRIPFLGLKIVLTTNQRGKRWDRAPKMLIEGEIL